ncbi:MAG: hypothetical protein Q7J73_01295 [Dehalococcoidales bacterium]|nr:hypothetical protein [Dehalococcoidales bacterium]
MEEKNELLRQIGWSEELIKRICSPDVIPMADSSSVEEFVITQNEISSTVFNFSLRNPRIAGGIHLLNK